MYKYTRRDFITHLYHLKRLNNETIELTENFKQLGPHTRDVDDCMEDTERIMKRLREEVFSPWRMWLFRHGRARLFMLEAMKEMGSRIHHHIVICSKSWKYPDSQLVRDRDFDLFRKREDIEARIRDNLLMFEDMYELACGYERRYGSCKNLLSDREFKIAHTLAGYLLGILSMWLASLLGWKM